MGRSRSELLPGLRSFTFSGYIIFYRLIAEGIEIVRVIKGSRDVEALFRES